MSKKQHLSRLAAPKTWPISRKILKWVAKPTPGPHNLTLSLPLIIILRDLLKVARTSNEAKFIMHNKDVLINKKPVRDIKLPVGLFDTISLPKLKQHYRLVSSKTGKFRLLEIPEKETNLIPMKITSKTTLKKDKTQLNLSNGWNLLSKEKIKVGDSILFNTETNKVEKKLALDKGSTAYVIGGKHSSSVGVIKDIQSIGELRKEKTVTLTLSKDEEIITTANHIFIIGDTKAAVKVE